MKSNPTQSTSQPVRLALPARAYSFFCCLLLLACGACTSPTPSPTPALTPSLAPPPSAVPMDTAQPPLTGTPTPLPSATPSPTPPSTQVCSPLAVQPLDKIRQIVTQPFIMPRILAGGVYSDDAHHGVDLGYYTRDGVKFTGTPVLAAMDAKVAAVSQDRPPYGNMVILETTFEHIPPALVDSQKIPGGDSLYTLYAHMQNLGPLKIGREIRCGQQIAETGLTGFTGGPHLHFETRWGPAGATFSGMGFYRADLTKVEMDNYKLWRNSGQFHLFDPLDLLDPKPAPTATPTRQK